MKKRRQKPPAARPATLDARARARIIRWRTAARMTQKELGQRIGRQTAWVSRYENAYFPADLDTLARLAAAFGQSLFAVLDLGGATTEQQLIERFRAIHRPAARRMVMTLITELAGGTAQRAGRRSGRA